MLASTNKQRIYIYAFTRNLKQVSRRHKVFTWCQDLWIHFYWGIFFQALYKQEKWTVSYSLFYVADWTFYKFLLSWSFPAFGVTLYLWLTTRPILRSSQSTQWKVNLYLMCSAIFSAILQLDIGLYCSWNKYFMFYPGSDLIVTF